MQVLCVIDRHMLDVRFPRLLLIPTARRHLHCLYILFAQRSGDAGIQPAWAGIPRVELQILHTLRSIIIQFLDATGNPPALLGHAVCEESRWYRVWVHTERSS